MDACRRGDEVIVSFDLPGVASNASDQRVSHPFETLYRLPAAPGASSIRAAAAPKPQVTPAVSAAVEVDAVVFRVRRNRRRRRSSRPCLSRGCRPRDRRAACPARVLRRGSRRRPCRLGRRERCRRSGGRRHACPPWVVVPAATAMPPTARLPTTKSVVMFLSEHLSSLRSGARSAYPFPQVRAGSRITPPPPNIVPDQRWSSNGTQDASGPVPGPRCQSHAIAVDRSMAAQVTR